VSFGSVVDTTRPLVGSALAGTLPRAEPTAGESSGDMIEYQWPSGIRSQFLLDVEGGIESITNMRRYQHVRIPRVSDVHWDVAFVRTAFCVNVSEDGRCLVE
jgi:hypothetical protein